MRPSLRPCAAAPQAKAFFQAHPAAMQVTLDAVRAALRENPNALRSTSGADAGLAAAETAAAVDDDVELAHTEPVQG